MVRVLRLTLAGGRHLRANFSPLNGWLARLLCGNVEWSLRPQTPPPAFTAPMTGPRIPECRVKKALPKKEGTLRCNSQRGATKDWVQFAAYQTRHPGWWIGCPGVGPIRRCHIVGAAAARLTNPSRRTQSSRRRAWARERIAGPPASPTKQPHMQGKSTNAPNAPNPQAMDSGLKSISHNRSANPHKPNAHKKGRASFRTPGLSSTQKQLSGTALLR